MYLNLKRFVVNATTLITTSTNTSCINARETWIRRQTTNGGLMAVIGGGMSTVCTAGPVDDSTVRCRGCQLPLPGL